jgi:Predicted transmembrane transcriptional regulator (anti-sigma factor)
MSDDNHALAEVGAIDEELVAYLDGELDREAATGVERRLADDPAYRARLSQLQRTWDLLDTLQRTEADEQLVHSTVAMVAVHAAEEAKSQQMRAVRRRGLMTLLIAALVILSASTAYLAIHRRLSRPNRQLVRDLPVIEHVDEYRNIDSVDFLKQLERENLFAVEVDDGM